jgi:hypothetical protein
MHRLSLCMKNFIFIFLLLLIPYSLLSQKVTVQMIKGENAAKSDWQIMDENNSIVFSGYEFFRKDSVTFSLEANTRYFLQVSVSEIYDRNTNLYTLIINGEPVILIKSEIGPGDHFFPFFTGIRISDVKITGGTTASISDFPWQVYLISGEFLCGGTIIAENWILTAAHCTKNSFGNPIPAASMSVKVGANNPRNANEGQKYNVSEVIVHESYDAGSHENDIALLKLQQPVNYPNAVPVKLITSEDVAYGATDPGVMSWVTGWGLIHVNPNNFPTSLQKVQLPIVSNAQASLVWHSIPVTDIMAGYLNGNKDACSGDSGGPLIVPVVDEYKVAGIVSWGSSNCNTYGGYTRVSYFENWIRANTGIAKEYRPPEPVGDTLVCQGEVSDQYSVENQVGATVYEWRLSPSSAGVASGNSRITTVLWNKDFTGAAVLLLRVTIDNKVSEWSKLDINVVLKTKLLSQSGDTTICAEQPISLRVVAEGYNLQYKWYKNGNIIQSGPSSHLSISGTTTDNSGSYVCEVLGYCNTVTSKPMNLTVLPLTKISYISPDVDVSFGNDVTLEVKAEGHNLIYQWHKDDSLIENSNSSILYLYSLNASNTGLYWTTVKGTCGTEISDTVYLYVKRPYFTGEPEVFLWPSVTSDEFNVALSNDLFYSIYIYNTAGQIIREQTNCRYKTTINVNTLPRGTYIVVVFNNNFRKSLKIIKV